MRSVALILLWSILALLAQATPVVAQTPNRAALVVSYDEGVDVAVCVSFNEEEISGHELLRRAELGMKSEPSGGFGEAVCRIDVTGCDIPQQKCFCECLGADCFYWSYWRLENGAWKFSQQGSSSTTVRNGSVDGWVWGRGTLNQDAERLPPPIAYEEVCVSTTPTSTGTSTSTATATTPQQSAATPTFTPTPTPTVTATATHTREPSEKTATPTPLPSATPTSGPTSTVTPTPFVPPTILVFAPDRTPISFGDSVTLVWDVADSTRVILRYPGGEEEVAAQGSKAVSPEMTTQYALFAASPVGEAESVITVAVNAVISVPTPDTAVQESTPLPSQPTVTWTPTWTPEPTQTPEPTHTPLPTNTSVPEPTSTPIPESAVIAEAPAPVLAQQESPLVVTVVVTPESVEMTATEVDSVTPTPAIVLLEPVDSAEVAAYPGAEKESIPAAERAFMVGGLALVVGTPLIFAGIWLLVWLVWRRQ